MDLKKFLKKKDKRYLFIVIAVFIVALMIIILFETGYIGRTPGTIPERKTDALENAMKSLNASDEGIKKEVPKEVIDSLTAPVKSPESGNPDGLSASEQEQKNQEAINSMSAPKK